MGKLDELRQLVADMFDKAEDKASIEKLSAINKSIKEVSEEQKSLVDKNAELIKSYKDLVQHTSFKDEKAPEDTISGPKQISFEEALQDFMSKNK